MAENFLEGHLLIASAELRDPNFSRSVVLLIRHNDEGAFGLILNRPTTTKIKDVWGKISQSPCNSDELLHLGGPVQGPLMAIHRNEEIAGLEILPGVLFTTESTDLEKLLAQSDATVKFYVGYAGWSPGQLEAELAQDSWLTTPAQGEQIFTAGEEMWELVTRRAAGSALLRALGIKPLPGDPSLN